MAKKVKDANTTNRIYDLASAYSDYIVKNHCTLAEAAKYFHVPMQTLWSRLEQLTPTDRTPSKRVAAENKVRAGHELHERRNKRKC